MTALAEVFELEVWLLLEVSLLTAVVGDDESAAD